jgi:hypothetical protein
MVSDCQTTNDAAMMSSANAAPRFTDHCASQMPNNSPQFPHDSAFVELSPGEQAD